MKARDWLVSKGLAKATRGKFSTAAHEALNKAIADGVKFSDYPKAGTVSPTSSPTETPVVKSDPRDSVYIVPSDYRFPEAEYEAVASDGKRYGMRECCSNCRVSFVNHACNSPVIYGNIAVTIVARKGVKHST